MNKRLIARGYLLSYLFCLPMGFMACSQDRNFEAQVLSVLLKQSVPIVRPRQLAVGLASDSSLVLLDSRARREYDVSHLRGARLVGYDDFDVRRVRDLPKNAPIVVYCSVGYRSEKVGEKLVAAGYTNVRNLYGGIFAWVNEGHPVYEGNQRPTRRVHAYSRLWGKWLNKGEKVYE
ncbi:MAG: rhodanese-like domain-containing protein [Ferruginibacter sp.]|nr:rhodanese-like domain-containing protein [Cytophagales bacterium]